MDIWEPMNCCIYYNRRTGTLILGYLSSIISLGGFLACIAFTAGEIISCQHGYCSLGITAMLCAGILLFLLNGALSVLLVIGTHKKKPALMIPYMILHAFLLVINVVRTVIEMMALLGYGPSGVVVLLLCVFLSVIIMPLQYHFLCVINAHYRELKGDFGHKRLVEFPDCDGKAMESKREQPGPERIEFPRSNSTDGKPPPYEP